MRWKAAALLCALLWTSGLEAQVLIFGAELGVGYRTPGSEMATFIESYNEVNEASIDEPLSEMGGVASLAWGGRIQMVALPVYMSVSLGAAGYDAESSTLLTDGGGRSVRLEVRDFVAGVDLGYGFDVGRMSMMHVGPTLIARVRETTLTGVRRFQDGSTDEGQSSPVSALSGEFSGSVAQFALGGTFGLARRLNRHAMLYFRSSATYPVGEYEIVGRLERSDGTPFPVDMHRFQDELGTSDDNAMRTGMRAIEFELLFGIGYGSSY